MTETTRAEVDELLEAFAKVSTLFIQQQLRTFQLEQSETNQRLARALQVTESTIAKQSERITEMEKELAWMKTALGKFEAEFRGSIEIANNRIDAAGKYVKSLKIPVDSGNGTH